MRFAKRQFDERYIWDNFVINGAGNPLGDVIEIDGDFYVIFDGRQNANCAPQEDVWLVKDYSSGDFRCGLVSDWDPYDNFVPVLFRGNDGIFLWEFDYRGQWQKYPHPKEHLIQGYSIREAIFNVMGY